MAALGVESTRQTVVCWEQLLNANWLAQSRRWHESETSRLGAARATGSGFTWQIHRLRSDATNTPAAQRHKAYMCEALSKFGCSHPVDDEPWNFRRAYADMMQIPDPCTGSHLRQLLLKQIRSEGKAVESKGKEPAVSQTVTVEVTASKVVA